MLVTLRNNTDREIKVFGGCGLSDITLASSESRVYNSNFLTLDALKRYFESGEISVREWDENERIGMGVAEKLKTPAKDYLPIRELDL